MTTFRDNPVQAAGKLSLAEILEIFTAGGELPLKFSAYDGSTAGPDDAELGLDLLSPRGTTYLATAPGDLGLARAYVSGDLDMHGVHPGDPYEMLKALDQKLDFKRPPARVLVDIVRSIGIERLKPIAPPPQEALPRWRRIAEGLRHSKKRDAEAIHHHYDVSNAFYDIVLGPSMTYSCALWERPGVTLEQAQTAKYELVARKLGLRPGMRLLDVGCGWGGMALHAASRYGVHVVGITLSEPPASYALAAARRAGLAGRVTFRVQDYRDVRDGPFDAISSIGMVEHLEQFVGVARVNPVHVQVTRDVGPGQAQIAGRGGQVGGAARAEQVQAQFGVIRPCGAAVIGAELQRQVAAGGEDLQDLSEAELAGHLNRVVAESCHCRCTAFAYRSSSRESGS